jgi:hypothetical protein
MDLDVLFFRSSSRTSWAECLSGCEVARQAVNLMDSWINVLVRDASHGSSTSRTRLLRGLFSFAVGLGFSPDPCGIFAVSLSSGLLCREALGSVVGSHEQFL